MRHRDCPGCGYTVPSTGLRINLAGPTRLTASWPRFYCPSCGVELRSSNRSLVPSFLFLIAGLVALLVLRFVPAPLTDFVQILGVVGIAGSLACAYWFHRWEVVHDSSA